MSPGTNLSRRTSMSTVEHVTLDELENLMRDLDLPTETRMTVIFENEDISPDFLTRLLQP